MFNRQKHNNRIVSDFWGGQFDRMRSDSGYWQNNKLVYRHTCELETGTPHRWLHWTLNEYFADRRFPSALSICCGDGPHELLMLQSGKIDFLRAFDISSGALDKARRRFADAGIAEDRYRLDIMDVNRFDIDGSYDLVVSAGAAHHVEALEHVFGRIAGMLAPEGRFVLLEYVGPDRFQWTDRQVGLINDIVAALAPEYLYEGRTPVFNRPTVEEMMRIDPSEAVRSSDILPLVDRYFEVEYRRDYNGSVMHQLYPLLNNALADRDRPDFDSILRLILAFEDFAIKTGALETDFAFIICKARKFGTS